MAVPISICSYAVNVTTNIAICTLLAPLPFGAGAIGVVSQTQSATEIIALASYEIYAGSSGVGTVVTFQCLGLDSTSASPVWRTLSTGGGTSTPLTITLANSTPYGGYINGPFHGLRMLISSATGNGILYARLSATLQ